MRAAVHVSGEKIVAHKPLSFCFVCYNIIAKRYPPTHRVAVFEEDTPAVGRNRFAACARGMRSMRAALCRVRRAAQAFPAAIFKRGIKMEEEEKNPTEEQQETQQTAE